MKPILKKKKESKCPTEPLDLFHKGTSINLCSRTQKERR